VPKLPFQRKRERETMSVSIQAMEDFATSLPEVSFSTGGDIGNVIEVSNLDDDMGMSLLANSKYSSSSSSTQNQANSGFSFNIESTPKAQETDFSQNIETIHPIDLDFGSTSSPPSISIQRESSYQPANSYGSDGMYANKQSASGPAISLAPAMQRDPIKEAAEKSDLINKLQRLEAKGFPVAKRFTMDNSLEEVKQEYSRLVDARQLETSIRFQRNMLMGLVTGMEWMNNKFDPFDLKLDGWSEGVHENIDDYDEIFEELYDKYKEKGKMPPEARLVFQLAGSGFMCHVTNSFFRSKMPSADDIFKNNPDLAKQFAAAAAQQAAPGFGNFMGMAMGVPQQQQGPQGVPVSMASGPGAFFNSPQMPQHVAANPPVQTARREMSGPSGVDDILKTFEEIRMAEEHQQMNMPSQLPMMNSNPAMAAAAEIQSLASEDVGSFTTERTTGGRRRRRQAPSGNVVSLNV
jgi:hypothetical protein